MAFSGDAEGGRIELQTLRDGVSCAVVLEQEGFQIDKRESSRRSQKYRARDGRIIIINHDGRGWWDPHDSVARGDVFKLVQYLHPGTSLGQVRQRLRPMLGLIPRQVGFLRSPRRGRPPLPVIWRWKHLPIVVPGSAAWRYLAEDRALPASVLVAAIEQDVLREGVKGTACFVHRDANGAITTYEMRGPGFRGCASDSTKSLLRFGAPWEAVQRIAVTEAAIDALSLAALEGLREGTVYLSTAGGIGPDGVAALTALMVSRPQAELVIGVDRGTGGDRIAATLAAAAEAAGTRHSRLLLPEGHKDWNERLIGMRGGPVSGLVEPDRGLLDGAKPKTTDDEREGALERDIDQQIA